MTLRTTTLADRLAGPVQGAARAVRGWPWYLQVTLIYAAARFISFCIFAAVARQQGPSPWGSGRPDYLEFINIWDAEWYQRIYADGYPGSIPRHASGAAAPNAWAFYPLYPVAVRLTSTITGLGWSLAAPLVSTLAGLAALLVIYQLFVRVSARAARWGRIPGLPRRSVHENALWGVVLVAVFPVSPILQVPYAESLHLLLLASGLYLLLTRRYLAAVPLVLLMSLARPAAVPFALLVALHVLLRLHNRRKDPLELPQLLRAGTLAVASAAGALAWPAIAWMVTGEITAYTDTETAWRGRELVLFEPWFTTGQDLFGNVLGMFAPLLLAAAAVVYLDSAAVRALGTDLRLWCGAYLLYLLAFLHPQTSTFRLLLPLFPLALGAVFLSGSRTYRGSVTVLFVILQLVWVAWLWLWTQLPGGGDYPP